MKAWRLIKLSRRTDLPLDRDDLGRFLPWIIGFMVYLSVLAVAGLLAMDGMAERWRTGIESTMTVQIPASDDPKRDDERVKNVVGVLRAIPEVIRTESIPQPQILGLLEPWIGKDLAAQDLPLPRLVDVDLRPGSNPDMAMITDRLQRAAPGAIIDDHRIWLRRLLDLIHSAQALAGAILAFIALATVGTVVFTTRTGLAIHMDVIEVLHFIGAQDDYIADQFAARAMFLGLKGGGLGLGLGVPTLMSLDHFAGKMAESMLPHLTLGFWQWVVLALLPLGVAAIAAASAKVTVLRALARML